MECFVLRLVGRENVEGGMLRLTLLSLGGSIATASALVEMGATTATNATIHNKPIVFVHEPIEKP
jgi:hypothetical protein